MDMTQETLEWRSSIRVGTKVIDPDVWEFFDIAIERRHGNFLVLLRCKRLLT